MTVRRHLCARRAAARGAERLRRRRQHAWAFFQWRRFLLKRLERDAWETQRTMAALEREQLKAREQEMLQLRARTEAKVRAARDTVQRQAAERRDAARRWLRGLAVAYAQLYARRGQFRPQVPRGLLWSLAWRDVLHRARKGRGPHIFPRSIVQRLQGEGDNALETERTLLVCAKIRPSTKEVCCRLIVDPRAEDPARFSARALMTFLTMYSETELWRVHICVYNRAIEPRREHINLVGFLPRREWEEYFRKGFVPDRYAKELRLLASNEIITQRLRRQNRTNQGIVSSPKKERAVTRKKKTQKKPRCDMSCFPKMEIRALFPSRRQWLAWGSEAQEQTTKLTKNMNEVVQQTCALAGYHFLSQLSDK